MWRRHRGRYVVALAELQCPTSWPTEVFLLDLPSKFAYSSRMFHAVWHMRWAAGKQARVGPSGMG